MSTTITQASDPVLWASLSAMVEQGNLAPGWIQSGSDHYQIVEATNEDLIFILYDNIPDLVDSRSSKGPRATYKELDK